MMSLKNVLLAICIWLLVCKSAEGSDINCFENCACCKDGKCGQNYGFTNACILGCIDGYAGARCYKKCPKNCKTCETESNIEYCTVCHDGYYPGLSNDCTSECLPNCKTCSSGSTCISCKEEYYNDNGSNDCRYRKCPGNCKCENDQCLSCMGGYYDTSNSCRNLCSGNCVTCSSSTYCESCKNGHYNGYRYDDSSHPLLNDCTYECRNSCMQCSSYDSCSVCKTGLYGSVCEKSCSAGCITGFCDTQTGGCDCSPNFVGNKCDRCQNGKYGDMCDKKCSPGCKGNVCEKESGNCVEGCIEDRIVGDKCDACSIGWYGPNCNFSCSVGCKYNQCKRTDGECTNECLNNFIGKQCDLCINGKYGEVCKSNCPDNCDDKGCLKEFGNCIECAQNFDGEECEKCVISLYGSSCSENCPFNCLNNTCDRDSGTCSYGCVDNYSGDRCCVNNNNCMTCSSYTKCKQCKSGYFNDQCDESCHNNCVDSCSIKTGKCNQCKGNFYGKLCNISCSSTCKTETGKNQCQQTDGMCLYGCVDGFYGLNCTERCSVYCTERLCHQDDGTCKKGFQIKVQDDPICPVVSGSKSQEQPRNTAIIVLGSLLAVAVLGNIVQLILLIYCQRRNADGQTKRPLYENTDVELKCDTLTNVNENPYNNQGNSRDYEDLGSVQAAEHEYGQLRALPDLK